MAELIKDAAEAGDKDGVHDGLRELACANSLWSQLSIWKEEEPVLAKLHKQMDSSFKNMKKRSIERGYGRDDI